MTDLPAMRERVAERLESEGAFDLSRPLRDCGEGFELCCRACGDSRPALKQCTKRWCPVCARRIAAKRVDAYQAVIDKMRWPLLVTLTMPHTRETSDASDVRLLRRSLSKLRRLRWWRRSVMGGVTAIEVTCGKQGWHPHAHMLIDCRWLSVTAPEPPRGCGAATAKRYFKSARDEVGEQWRLCLQTDKRVQVQVSRARPEAAREVLKYATKAADLVETELPIAPLIRILQVSRLISAFGSVRADKLVELAGQLSSELPGVQCACGCSDWVPDFVEQKDLELRSIRCGRERTSTHAPGSSHGYCEPIVRK